MSPEERAQQIEEDLKMADAKRRADAEKESEMEKDEKAKADADAGIQLDKLLSCLDAMTSKFDSFSARMDAMETSMMDSKKRKDAEGEIEEKGDPKEMTCDSRADSVEIRNELAEIQTMADRAASAWSKSAPHPWVGELPDAYCRRLAAQHQQHSEKWGDGVNLRDLSGKTLRNASREIFQDSITKSCNPIAIGSMNLHEVKRRDPESGHMIKEYYGDPMAWMSQFTGQKRIARFNLSGRRGGE
jgi:hypothetical protein